MDIPIFDTDTNIEQIQIQHNDLLQAYSAFWDQRLEQEFPHSRHACGSLMPFARPTTDANLPHRRQHQTPIVIRVCPELDVQKWYKASTIPSPNS